MQDMIHTIRNIFVLVALFIVAASETWAVETLTNNGITVYVDKIPGEGGTVSISSVTGTTDHTVTLTVEPATGYSISANLITAEPIVSPSSSAPQRAPGLMDPLEVTGSGTSYSFNLPSKYTAAYVTVTFYEGTIGEVTLINDLDQIRSNLAGKYKLVADIDATGFTGIANFTGSLDGNYHIISNLEKPIFTTLDGGVVKNINLQYVKISQAGPVGAIAGTASGYSRIYNCGILPSDNKYDASTETSYVKSTDGYCGGLVGWLKDDSRVINCFSYANITGGTDVAGIVGHNEKVYETDGVSYGSTTQTNGGKYYRLKTAVVNCMFYGNITNGDNRYPVYGGAKMLNKGANGINNYDFYRAEASLGLADDAHYNCSWPAKEEYLTQYEFYRYLLNSNRELCGWWVGAESAPSTMTIADVKAVPKDTSLMAKWVLDPSIAPYPILKQAGRYPSVVNQAPRPDEMNPQRIDPETKQWVSRGSSTNTEMKNPNAAPETDGRSLGTISVKIKKNPSDDSTDKDIIITAMDIDNNDFCYGKIQLPYYNSIFGNPSVQIDPNASATDKAAQWNSRYGGNYGDNVVVGWTISVATTEGVANVTNTKKVENDKVVYDHTYSTDAESGYNFTDRYCTTKDENRVFAQGGYYYVPYGVSEITITAKWATATYFDNGANNSYDRVSGVGAGNEFAPAGRRSTTLPNGKTVVTGNIKDNIPSGSSVYEKAIVLVGNHQYRVNGNDIGSNGVACTIMSADFDLDEEPDNCLIWQLGTGTNRQSICPIRFDFLPVVEYGLAMKEDGSEQYYSLGCYRPLGHFEVTETSLIHFGQFEYGNSARTVDAPLILNGGIFDQYTKGTKSKTTANDNIDYIIIGGNVRIPSFTPGAHVNKDAKFPTRHCPVNVIGGIINNLYLTGNYNDGVTPNPDSPHCYIDGGNFKQVAAAGKEGIAGNVIFKVNHSIIKEFYGGSTLGDKYVTGSIDVTIDNSYVTKYCGGPKFSNLAPSAINTVTTNATGTTFGVYYGGGNGGTSYMQYDKADATVTDATPTGTFISWDDDTANRGGRLKFYTPTPRTYRSTAPIGYHADYEMEIVNTSTGTDAKKAIFRTYMFVAQFSKTDTGPIINNLTDCKVLTNFYGGGNLGGVQGDVKSTLSGSTRVDGSVFGAGYSASVPEVTIYEKDKTPPTINVYTGIITPTPENSGTSTTYTWTNKTTINGTNLSTSSPTATDTDGTKYFFTEESLDNLGTVSGKVTLNIEGTTIVGGSVYGGGEESGVDGNTEVKVTGGTIGTKKEDGTYLGGADYGNVYGGGKGKNDNVTAGLVKGTTTVTISGTPTIYHNVYGGGAYGSVGDFIYDNTTGLPTARKENTTGGVCTVTITGGTIGTNGHENGMVFGSSRGDVGQPGGITDKQAWVHSTQVTIGDAALETGPTIKGSVYGGGENGHTFTDAVVDIVKGTIGITDSEDPDGGARYPYRGNVYGGGCGTDTYTVKENAGTENEKTKTYFNRLAGIVEGNTEVNITGGHVVHNVYGGGAMGSVGVFTREASTDIHVPGKITGVTSGGKCTVTVSGGTVGNTGAKMINETGGPDDFGHVFGGARGQVHDLADYPNLGSESGHVRENTVVKIQGGQIGCGEGAEGAYTTWNSSVKSTAHWTYEANGHPYDQYAGTTGYNAEGGATTATDGHTFYGNVFGGGSGYYPYAPGKWLRSAGQVGGTATVTISDGQILNNVYGGCEMADVEGAVTVTMTGGTVGVPRTKEQIEALPTIGHIYGAGMGDKRIFFNTSTNVAQTTVNVTGGTVYGSVYGGGEDGHVLANATTTISQAENKTTVIGCDGTSGFDGNVFGGGQGSVTAKTAGVVAGDVVVNIEGGTMKGSVYGGGRLASVGTYFAMADNENYGKMQADVADDPATTEVNEAKSHGHIIVNLNGGIIHQNVYGGCMGTTDAGDESEDYGVSKTVEVNLNKQQCEGKDADNIGTATGCVVRGDIFGCNNTNASPQQTVTVHVYGTQNAAKNDIATKFFKATADLDDMTTLSSLKASIAALNSSTETPTEKEAQYNAQKAIYDNANSTAEQKQAALAEMKAIVLLAVADELGINTDAYTNATNENKQTALDNIKKAINESKYDVHAVYGGGNLAAYKPIGPNPTTTSDDGKNTTYSTNVIIDGCGLTSIRYAYGGGNAASTPATSLTVNGTYEIEEAFGGGNGKDDLPNGDPNPGANVGFHAYADNATNAQTPKDRADNYGYGSGKASLNIYGGTIHRVFGGSNTKGNVRQTAVTMLEEVGGCDFCVDEAYGGGKSAPMDAEAKLLMACIPGLNAAYGGAEAADIQGNVSLTITNGRFSRVFGGNNLSGTIRGAIKVNVEEVGCKPIIIGELYGGGNEAGYSIYGYKQKTEGGKLVWKPRESASDNTADGECDNLTTPYADPQVNVKSFTSIGAVYGGGYGKTAVMVGNPTVNVSVVEGAWKEYVGESSQYEVEGYVYDATGYKGETITITDSDGTTTHDVELPNHAKGKIGAIGQVFGGGNAAPVKGNTTVNIGTLEKVSVKSYVEKTVDAGASLEDLGLYTRSGAGTIASPYRYIAATGTAEEGTKYYEEKDVETDVVGVDIRGNVYGGGNNAEVTGNTNVQIGKKM